MSGIFKVWLIAIVLVTGHGLGVAAEHGCIRLVNVVDRGGGPLQVRIDGRVLRPAGYGYGEVTGSILLSAGTHVVQFERTGVAAGRCRVIVRPGGTTGVVVHAVEVMKAGLPTGKWRIRALRVSLEPAGDRRQLHLVSVVPGDAVVVGVRQPGGKWRDVSVRHAAVVSGPLEQHRGYQALRSGGRRLGSVPVEETGNHVVVLHRGADDRLAMRSYVERQAWSPADE